MDTVRFPEILNTLASRVGNLKVQVREANEKLAILRTTLDNQMEDLFPELELTAQERHELLKSVTLAVPMDKAREVVKEIDTMEDSDPLEELKQIFQSLKNDGVIEDFKITKLE